MTTLTGQRECRPRALLTVCAAPFHVCLQMPSVLMRPRAPPPFAVVSSPASHCSCLLRTPRWGCRSPGWMLTSSSHRIQSSSVPVCVNSQLIEAPARYVHMRPESHRPKPVVRSRLFPGRRRVSLQLASKCKWLCSQPLRQSVHAPGGWRTKVWRSAPISHAGWRKSTRPRLNESDRPHPVPDRPRSRRSMGGGSRRLVEWRTSTRHAPRGHCCVRGPRPWPSRQTTRLPTTRCVAPTSPQEARRACPAGAT